MKPEHKEAVVRSAAKTVTDLLDQWVQMSHEAEGCLIQTESVLRLPDYGLEVRIIVGDANYKEASNDDDE